MSKGTLKRSKVTNAFRIVPVTAENCTRFNELMGLLDEVFRNCSIEALAGAGIVAYVGIARHAPRATLQCWFKGKEQRSVPSLYEAEQQLLKWHTRPRGTTPLWKIHLAGQQHDYYFYSQEWADDFLNLLIVNKIMDS